MRELPLQMQQRYSNQKQTAIPVSRASTAHAQTAQQRPQNSGSAQPPHRAPQAAASQQSTAAPQDDLARIFNTALIASQAEMGRDFSAELYQLTQSASFKAILSAVRHLSRVQGIHERQAAEQVIQTFRKMDEIWGEYLYREGVDRLRQPRR